MYEFAEITFLITRLWFKSVSLGAKKKIDPWKMNSEMINQFLTATFWPRRRSQFFSILLLPRWEWKKDRKSTTGKADIRDNIQHYILHVLLHICVWGQEKISFSDLPYFLPKIKVAFNWKSLKSFRSGSSSGLHLCPHCMLCYMPASLLRLPFFLCLHFSPRTWLISEKQVLKHSRGAAIVLENVVYSAYAVFRACTFLVFQCAKGQLFFFFSL